MTYISNFIASFFCLFNTSLSSDTIIKKNNEKITTVSSLSEEECENINNTLKLLDSIIQSNTQKTHIILTPLHTPNIPVIPTLATDPEEIAFIAELGIDIMRITERSLITREDYISEHTDAQTFKAIQEYKKQCILFQQQGDLDSLFKEINRLYQCVIKNGKKNTFMDYVCLAIAEKVYSNPIAVILHTIRHEPLKKACHELQSLKMQILKLTQEKNTSLAFIAEEFLVEQYEFDILAAAHNCYLSRNDEMVLTNHQPTLSPNLQNVLSMIEHESLPTAYAELIHLKKQIIKYLESNNILDPIEQQNFILKNFGFDIIEFAHNIYRGRLDHKNLICFFYPISLQDSLIAKLAHPKYDRTSLASFCHTIAEYTFYNANLCNLEITPEIESQVFKAIEGIKSPSDDTQFQMNMTLINQILNDIEAKTYAIVDGKPVSPNSSMESFEHALNNFIARLNIAK